MTLSAAPERTGSRRRPVRDRSRLCKPRPSASADGYRWRVLVYAPAHPRFPHRPDIVEYEVRRTVDGHLVLPVFTTVKRLVKTLGSAQPWVELPLESVERSVGVVPDIAVVVDPTMTQDLWRWDVDSLRAAMERSGTPMEDKELGRVG